MVPRPPDTLSNLPNLSPARSSDPYCWLAYITILPQHHVQHGIKSDNTRFRSGRASGLRVSDVLRASLDRAWLLRSGCSASGGSLPGCPHRSLCPTVCGVAVRWRDRRFPPATLRASPRGRSPARSPGEPRLEVPLRAGLPRVEPPRAGPPPAAPPQPSRVSSGA